MEKAHMEIILEDIKGKFDLVLEGHAVLHKEIQDAKKELNEKIEYNNFLIHGFHDSLNKKIDGVEASLNKKIDGVEASLNKKIDGVEDRLNKKIDGVEDKLNKKIEGVESRLTDKIDAVAADLAAHRADTETHRTAYRVSE